MFPRPIHRWKSFWLGLLFIAFLGWSWGASKRQGASMILYSPVGNLEAGHWNGYLCASYEHPTKFRAVSLTFQSFGITFDPAWLPPILNSDYHWFRIAHWSLILLFLVPWAGFLVWRVRRVKRLAGAVPVAQN